MKRQSLWEISVVTPTEAEEAVVELLGRVFKHAAAVYCNEKTRVTRASVYCLRRAEWSPAKRAALAEGLRKIKSNGLNIGAARIRVRPVKREDWSECWKRHFKPIEIGARLLIKPSWVHGRPQKNQAVVVLDPGLSFGTGNHPTTYFCLRELAAGRTDGQSQSFLDIGTGSGILSIAAVKLGYAPVKAFDIDPEAVRVARENARQNGVLNQLHFSQQDAAKLPLRSAEKYDFICANLISNLLIVEKRRIVNRLRPGGRLVLAGILREEFPLVQHAYEQLGLELARCRVRGEWRSGSFVLKKYS